MFCRKCGRRLAPYSKNCSDCGTSTDCPMIKFKKVPASANKFEGDTKTKVAETFVLAGKAVLSFKIVDPTKHVKPAFTNKVPNTLRQKASIQKDTIRHQIKQSTTSIEEDIITNPKDYETQIFSYNMLCSYEHFWPKGKALPVSKGKAYCPTCGEQLREARQKSRR
jgi:hypothetical protein